VAWAKFYLKKARVVDNPRRGTYRITDRGRELLKVHGGPVNIQVLQRFPEFREFLLKSRSSDDAANDTHSSDASPAMSPTTSPAIRQSSGLPELTPEELLATGYNRLTGQLAADLLDRVKQASPSFFEDLVIDLLLALGYGGSRRDAGRSIGRSGDGGIDGIINEDRLGLDTIYVQAKRWDNTVGRPDVQKFAGALQGQRARKGVFITTSSFSSEALEFVRHLDSKIVLIDGDQLTRLMIDQNVGVAEVAAYRVKRVDSDYFGDE
jgi:restriction system protein